MTFWGIFGWLLVSRKKDSAKTDMARRQAHSDIAAVKSTLDVKLSHLTSLVDDTLRELESSGEDMLHRKKRKQTVKERP